jgi:hypothetical protein
VLSLGTGTLRDVVHVDGGRARPAGPPTATDVFGIRHGGSARGTVSVLADELGLFVGGTLFGSDAYEPITGISSSDQLLSGAGVNLDSLALVAVRQGAGNIVEVGLPGFAARLAHDQAERALFDAAYSLMTG